MQVNHLLQAMGRDEVEATLIAERFSKVMKCCLFAVGGLLCVCLLTLLMTQTH